MVKKKVIKPQANHWLKIAKSLIKKQPREFMIGFISSIFLLVLFIYLTLYYYRQIQTKPSITGTEEQQVSVTQPLPKYYQMQPGESLWDVAQKEYGNPYLYPTLVELNQLSSPDLVEPGMKIRIR